MHVPFYILVLSQTFVKYLYTVYVYCGNKCFRFHNMQQESDPHSVEPSEKREPSERSKLKFEFDCILTRLTKRHTPLINSVSLQS